VVYKGSYVKLIEDGSLKERVDKLKKHTEKCELCPRNCKVNRREKTGFCQAGDLAIISSCAPHFGEEDVLVGSKGSGTIFFGYCNMRCVFCQNHTLSFLGQGMALSNQKLADIMLYMQNYYGCHNINLVTPTHFTANIVEAIYIAAKKGLIVPIVYNCGGYESFNTLKLLDGIIDIYMPDFKYFYNESGRKYSQVEDYFDVAESALIEMDRQVGGLKIHEGIAYRGLLIRHLVLPGKTDETKEILNFIKRNLSEDVLVNLMDQYYPANLAYKYPQLNRRLGYREFKEVYNYGKELGLRLS
jgi:putative pyruvate formate lyase activating enzyme